VLNVAKAPVLPISTPPLVADMGRQRAELAASSISVVED
jgi:hypothetical protein